MAPQNKMSNARRALIKAGMSRSMARDSLDLLDLDKPIAPQIIALAEEEPELFGMDADGNPLDKGDDDRPMTRNEAIAARLRGDHVEGMTYRSKARRGPVTQSKSAREAADHLVANHKDTPPPVRQYIEPVRDINAGHAPLTREPNSSARALAARLKGN